MDHVSDGRGALLCHTKYLTKTISWVRFTRMFADRPLRARSRKAPAPRDHAIENLRFIRETMERSASFTGVPGWGGVAMGVTALVAAALAVRQPTVEALLTTWLMEAAVAIVIGAWAVSVKARAVNLPLLSGAVRKFVL